MFAIFGASGNAGAITACRLRRFGFPVTAVVRDGAKARPLADIGCEIAIADLRDVDAVIAALDGADTAQVICPVCPRSEQATAEMTTIVDSLCSALAHQKVRRVLAISDYGADLSEDAGNSSIFHRLEAQLETLAADVTLLRSAEHMQNWARLIPVAAEQGILPSLHHPVTKPFPTVSAVDVGRIAADLLIAEARSDGRPLHSFDFAEGHRLQVVHVEGPRRYSVNDVAAALTTLLGRVVVARELPRSEWMMALTDGGLSTDYARLVTTMFDLHNAGRIDAEAGTGEVRCGPTELDEVLATLVQSSLSPNRVRSRIPE